MFLPSKRPTLVFLAAIIAAYALSLAGCGGSDAGEINVKTAQVTRGDIEHRVIATGKVEPLSKVEIRSKVDGIIKTIAVDEGDRVSKGQVILELDKDILASRVREARGALERARARYEQAKIEASTSEMDSAQKRYDRLKKLFEQGLVPEQQLEDAETALTVSKDAYKARQAAITMAKAELTAVTAALERSENELGYATIVSPVDGIVLSRDVDVGSAVASVVSTMGTLIMTLGDVREMHIVGDVDESDVGLVREGMPARISVESYSDKKFHGTVKRISPLGVEKDKIMNFEVEVTITDNDVPLRANMTADAEIIVEKHQNALLVPQNAIRYDREQAFVEAPDRKEKTGKRTVNITLGITGTNFSEALSGLKEGDEVILAGK
ncbi:MAG: efflux RND transporter periplasmic adaptor subunit [Candidatus Lindowbacteria bacterium]|nr:efflux RND transporter periplasmic adaptor subunit [Candidatus Lindowbacteria bacterium]